MGFATGPASPTTMSENWLVWPGGGEIATRSTVTTTNSSTWYSITFPESLAEEPLQLKQAASRAAHATLVEEALERRPTSINTRSRHGYQQVARLPCYRGVRTR